VINLANTGAQTLAGTNIRVVSEKERWSERIAVKPEAYFCSCLIRVMQNAILPGLIETGMTTYT
jgi:hypothetical protein